MKKAPEAFRTISEVADLLKTPAHLLRFWESKFYQIKPVKRAGGRRYYRPDDVALINGIRLLLHDKGMTLRGVQRVLQEQGVKAVATMGLPLPESEAVIEDAFDSIDAETLAALEQDATIEDAEVLEPAAEDEPAPDAPLDLPIFSLRANPPPAPPLDDAPLDVDTVEQIAADPTQPAAHEDAEMTDDDLLAPLLAPVADLPSAPPLPASLAPLFTPEPAPEPTERIRLAKALRATPRDAPGLRRDRLGLLARRIDTLLERMSEASGAGRW